MNNQERKFLGDFELGPGGECEGIYTGDARELAKGIPDESVDLIFCDPVYWQLKDYDWLAETAKRILEPNSACLVWIGQDLLQRVLDIMSRHLAYAWLLIMQRVGGGNWGRVGTKKYEPLLWMEKGDSQPTRPRLWDFCQSSEWPKNHKEHWDKPQSVIDLWLHGFTDPDDIVCDPFAGSGVVPISCKKLGRKYLAFEIDPATAELARERVRKTQPPLPGLVVPVQQEMEL